MSEAQRLAAFLDSPLGKFRSWRTPDGTCPQGAFLRAAGDSRRVVFRSGNRVGKTAIGAVSCCLLSTGQHPWAQIPAPSHGWVSTLSWDFARDTIWPEFEKVIPMDQVVGISYRKGGQKKTPDIVRFRNGSTITFKSAEQGPDKYQGARIDWLWIDEEHPSDVVEEARMRLAPTQPVPGQLHGLLMVTLTPVRRARWVRELEREPGTVLIRTSMFEAAEGGQLSMDWVKATADRLPERQRRVRVYGDQVALEGIAYPDFSRATHCARVQGDRLVLGDVSWPWPLPAAWRRRAAMDFGFSKPSAVPLACEDPFHDRLIVYRVPYASGIRATRWAKHLDRVLPDLCRPLVCDHDAFARAELEGCGHATVAAYKDVDTGIEAVERLLMPLGDGAPGLVLVLNGETDPELGQIDAEKLAWEFEGYHYPEQKVDRPDVKDAPVKKDDHALDALRYLVMDWETNRRGVPMPPRARHRGRETTAISLGNAEEDWD